MYMVKKYSITICFMVVVSIVCLFVVSLFTFLFKWQADKALIGIIVTYILAGFTGGFVLRCMEKKNEGGSRSGIGQKIIEVLLGSGIFMILLFMCSVLVLQIPFEISKRGLIVFVLFLSSAFLGRVL